LRRQVLRAFTEMNCGFSIDRVIVDPELNSQFLNQCHSLGLTRPAVDLNLTLLNSRKAGLLKGRPRSIKTSFPDEESYRFASEIAARYIEKRDFTTLDRILCEPSIAAVFDELASDIAPGYLPLQYRWAALNLRKARSLRPELLSHVVRPITVTVAAVETLLESDLPSQQGLYLLYSSAETLYVGEASNLRKRVAKHLDHSDNKSLARWFWSHGFKNVRLELQVLDESISTKVRRALEAELIHTRHPMFNLQGLLVNP
jgi:predicted GIY-YIG superfamily endonuclease